MLRLYSEVDSWLRYPPFYALAAYRDKREACYISWFTCKHRDGSII